MSLPTDDMWDDWEAGEDGGLVAPEPARLAVVPTAPVQVPTWRPRDLEDVLDGTYQPPVPTVGRRNDGIGLFYAGRMHSIVGESEGGKTWFALMAVASELAAGNAVVFIDFEDDAPGVVGRLLALGTNRDHIRDRFAYIRPEDPLTVGFNRQEIGQALNDLRPTFVPVDGVTEGMAMHGMELKDNTDVAKFGRILLRPIAEFGAAVATLDHVVKDKEGRGRYAIGGVHKLNGINGAMYILENRTPFGVGLTGKSTVRIAKDRPGQLRRHALPHTSGLHWFADFVLKSHDETFAEAILYPPIENDGPVRHIDVMKRITDAIANAREPLNVRGLEARVGGKKDVLATALAVLVDEGYVEVAQGPNRAKLHTLLKPFEEEG
ncbi:AAA family ATPase [Streptomyces europaeiscabiei]|uniref:AAA family ATPase n=1 Tax=Streptomyces europaeiscabiei TaxID=146819 RepID=UPI0029B0E6B0|nr:AAA family ATPase [Streptomyces europaeiscabiei]MDX2770643.1 AAA family ATPase [Streptomyces europaeiscabiei]